MEAIKKIGGKLNITTSYVSFLPILDDLMNPLVRMSRLKILLTDNFFNLCAFVKSLIGNCPK